MPFMGPLVDWRWLRKESSGLRICQQKLPKVKSKEKKKTEKKKKKRNTDYPRTVDNYNRYSTFVRGIPEGEEKENNRT